MAAQVVPPARLCEHDRVNPERPSPKYWLRLAILLAFAGGVAAFFAFGGQHQLTLENIKSHREALKALTEAHYGAMIALAFIVYLTSTALSVPGGLVLSLTIGFLFGAFVGAAIIVPAGTLGATLVFLAARYVFADAARRRLGPVGEKINRGFTRSAFSYLLFLRLVPLFPFFLVNLAPAFSDIRVRTYMLATFIGVIPGSFVFANLGEALGSIDSLHGLLSTKVLLALGLLGVLALIPVAVRRFRSGNGSV